MTKDEKQLATAFAVLASIPRLTEKFGQERGEGCEDAADMLAGLVETRRRRSEFELRGRRGTGRIKGEDRKVVGEDFRASEEMLGLALRHRTENAGVTVADVLEEASITEADTPDDQRAKLYFFRSGLSIADSRLRQAARSAFSLVSKMRGMPKPDLILSAGRTPRRKIVMSKLVYECRKVLVDLLDGKTVRFPVVPGVPMLRIGSDGVLAEELKPWMVTDEDLDPLIEGFLRVLRIRPFPFRRCPTCTNIFVRSGKKEYCERTCATRAYEQSRKDEKREYMREYMADQRRINRDESF